MANVFQEKNISQLIRFGSTLVKIADCDGNYATWNDEMNFNLPMFISIGTVLLAGILVACEPVAQTPMTANLQVEGNETIVQTPIVSETVEQTPTKEVIQRPWELVWQDEFKGNLLNEANWTTEVNDWGGGNQELQYYTNRRENVYVENGLLNIVGRKESYFTRDYTSARLTSTRSWTYGRFEVKAKLPEGQGIWPAIWLRSAAEPYGSWAASGEIDIMEMLGNEPSVIYGTLHYGSPWPKNEQKQGSIALTSEGFHVFALEWDDDEIRWYVDGVKYLTIDSWYSCCSDYPAPFDQPFNIVLNLAIGGTWPGNPDEKTSFPQMLSIDYVRVYQR